MAVRNCRWLQRGDDGDDVRAYQQAANVWLIHQARLGIQRCGEQTRPAYLAEDGVYGPKTEGVTRWLQCRFGLAQDGRAGPETLGALRKFLNQESLGLLELRAVPAEQVTVPECVTPVRYTATQLANEHRISVGLPALPISGETLPPKGSWLVWVAGLVLGGLLWSRIRRGR